MTLFLITLAFFAGGSVGVLAMALAVVARRSDADAERRLIDDRRLYGDLATYGGTDSDDDETERTA